MTQAITPDRVLRAIDRTEAWYVAEIEEDGSTKIIGLQIPFKVFRRILEDNKITFNERTIMKQWEYLKDRGFYVPSGKDMMRSNPEMISKYLGIELTKWVPLKKRTGKLEAFA